jgi:hypothetical protein
MSQECPICFEAISQETGVVKMACKHSFHFSCLGAWFSTQFVNGQRESCPCCRHEASEKEALPKRSEDDPNKSFHDLLWSEDRVGEDIIDGIEFIPLPYTDSDTEEFETLTRIITAILVD